ncbi:RsiV family protein [Gillisia sp. M10.2A]|uniref:RsiV family protein n=1 Tax=Gillisia lutea TaxID=2909668 RepID=A0ABS9EI39_9FLAO|nr:RsiV family protein [Gillisia lutea]MCF4101118.1 RsiV family protein [Gillisia lutea]
MKSFISILFVIVLAGCKRDKAEPNDVRVILNEDSLEILTDSFPALETPLDFKKEQSFLLKREELLKKEDDAVKMQGLISSRALYREDKNIILDFKYPYLNESLKPAYENFNNYIKSELLNVKERDSLPSKLPEKRTMNYKIYNVNDEVVSMLFYQENFYKGILHPTYSFRSLNFNLTTGGFLDYEDVFITGSEEELREIINKYFTEKIASGDIYYDCWQISRNDFYNFKNNFVLDNTSIEFYFDDYIICPSYTGTYSIKIPFEMLRPVLKKYYMDQILR